MTSDSSNSDDEDIMQQINNYQEDPREVLEKSMTNYNVNTTIMMEKVIKMNRNHKEFCINFVKHVEMLSKVIGKLRVEGRMIREEMKFM
ncbi:hypothetical protein AgCh_006150 [Apium graveolens]